MDITWNGMDFPGPLNQLDRRFEKQKPLWALFGHNEKNAIEQLAALE